LINSEKDFPYKMNLEGIVVLSTWQLKTSLSY
jgi:hypothetical protein